MKILCVNCVISEFGGVEYTSMNLARELAKRGHEVHFLGASGVKPQLRPSGQSDEKFESSDAIVHFHFEKFPRIYPLGEKRGLFQKLIWHAQDLFDPRNERVFRRVLLTTRPDIILLHNITAVGVNIWRTIARSKIPCIQIIHDYNLVCMNMSRFRGGNTCEGLCTACAAYKAARFSMIRADSNFAFVSPSRSMLNLTENYVDLSGWPRAVIHNANRFLVHPKKDAGSVVPRLLYIGRIDPAKGVGVLLQAAELAAREANFEVHIMGAGSAEQELRTRYADAKWLTFHGNVSQQEIASMMAEASALTIPGIWPETAPVVAVHAMFAGLPVIGSRIGGVPEYVFDGQTGMLLPPGDVNEWSKGILKVVQNPGILKEWSLESLKRAPQFDASRSIEKYEQLMGDMIRGRARAIRNEELTMANGSLG